MSPWLSDNWDAFIDDLASSVRAGFSEDDLRAQLEGKTVCWTGIVSDNELVRDGDGIEIEMNPKDVDLGEGKRDTIDYVYLPISVEDRPNWLGVRSGDRVTFEATLGSNLKSIPPVRIENLSSGRTLFTLRIRNGHLIERIHKISGCKGRVGVGATSKDTVAPQSAPSSPTESNETMTSTDMTHWQYSFYCVTCRVGESVRTTWSQLLGKTIEHDCLTRSDIDAIRDVFAKYGFEESEPSGDIYRIDTKDGGYLLFRCGDLDDERGVSGFEVEVIVRQLFDEILTIILDIAQAGNLCLSFSSDSRVRVVGGTVNPKLLDRYPDAESLSSPAELRRWLEDTVGGLQVRISF